MSSSLSLPSPSIRQPDKKAVILVCFIWSVRDSVITVIEWENRPWKKRWQTGVVFETLNDWEDETTWIGRALQEELHLTMDDVENAVLKWDFLLDIDATPSSILFGASVYLIQLKTSTRIQKDIGNPEILAIEPRLIASLNGDTRPWTKTAIGIALGKSMDKKNHFLLKVKDGYEILPE